MIVNTVGPAGAKMFLVGEAPGKDEDAIGQPFVGYAGKTLNWLLSQANISRAECLVGNVARVRPPNNKISLYFQDTKCTIPTPQMQQWIEQLRNEIILHKPNVVITLGVTAFWALTGKKAIGQHRGYITESTLVPGLKVLPTYHPQNINYEWKNYFPTVMDLRKARKHSEFREFITDKREILSDVNPAEFIQFCREILDRKEWDRVSVDIETVPGRVPHTSIIGFAPSSQIGMSLSFIRGKYSLYSENQELELWRWIARVMREKNLIMQNGAYDLGVLYEVHRILGRSLVFDTLIGGHVVWPELPRDLGFLGSMCLDVPEWKTKANENKPRYNCLDAINTFGIAEVLEREIAKSGQQEIFDFEMSQIPLSLKMQLQGIPVDRAVQKEMIENATEVVGKTGDSLRKILGREINFNSPKQLQKLFYVDLGLPVQYKRRKHASDERKITSDATAIRKLSQLVPDNPLFNLILEHKKYLKLRDSFLDIELSPEDTAHTSYNITGSSTDDEGRKSFGRWSSSASIIKPFGSGNLQNIPEEARLMYKLPDGYKFIQADLVQAEAVVVAYLINDQRLKKSFKDSFGLRGEARDAYDVHKITASQMFGVPVDQVTKDMRKVGKTLRHATNYSAGPGVVSTRLGCSMSEAKKLLEAYHRICPQLKMWHQIIQNKLQANRVLSTVMGRQHRFLDRYGDELFRSAYSFEPQSTVGDLLNKGMIRLYKDYGSYIDIRIQLHDAVYVVSNDSSIPAAVRAMKECLIQPMLVNNDWMIIDVDFKVGQAWGGQESIDDVQIIKEVFGEDSYSRFDSVLQRHGITR